MWIFEQKFGWQALLKRISEIIKISQHGERNLKNFLHKKVGRLTRLVVNDFQNYVGT